MKDFLIRTNLMKKILHGPQTGKYHETASEVLNYATDHTKWFKWKP